MLLDWKSFEFKNFVLVIVFFLGSTFLTVSVAANNDLTPKEKEEGFVSLFNGQDLSGWIPMGNEDVFSVEDEMIVLEPGGGRLLCTEKEYEDFILRIEYKIAPRGNSGIFFHVPEHGRFSRIGGEIQITDSHDRDTLDYGCAGALYGVFPPKVNAAKLAGEWNQMEISCQWPHLKVTLNGRMVQDINCREDVRLKWRKRWGPIGIQDHGGKAWFRNIRIKDLGGNEKSKWISLFNGKDLTRWNIIGNAEWKVENGELVARNGNGYAITDKEYKDFHLWAYVWASDHSNGGIFYRWNKPGDRGNEVQIYNVKGAKNMTGSIYNVSPAPKLYSKNKHWFLMQIVLKGKHALVLINGKPIAESNETVDRFGHISLQMHSRDSYIRFKDLRIKPL